jgi:hypothetical protein
MSKHRRIVAVATMLVTCVAMAVSLCLSTAYAAPRSRSGTTPSSPHSTTKAPKTWVTHQSLLSHTLPARPQGKLIYHPPMGTKHSNSFFPRKGSKQAIPTVQGSGPLTYHGGPVEHNPNVVLIFWGSLWGSDPTSGAAANVIVNEFAHLGHTRYDNTLSQYYDGGGSIANSINYEGDVFDTSTPVFENLNCPVSAVDDSTLQLEVNAVISFFGLPTNDGNTTYFVFTEAGFEIWNPSNGCSAPAFGGSTYCGYHSFDFTAREAYAAMPFSYLPECWIGVDPNLSPEGDALANTAAHEESESITDPLLNAWFDSVGFEIGDKCNFEFEGAPGGYTFLNNNTVFAIQTEYSNASGECVNAYAPDTVGAYIPGSPSFFCLRAKLTVGGCDIAVPFGVSGDIPIVGDWTSKGYDSIGVYIPGSPSYFCLRNTNTPGGCDIAIPFGVSGDIPVVGDWTGKGYDSIGIYRPSTGFFCLRNSNVTGPCDISLFLGGSGDIPVVGDWFAQGINTVGVWIPAFGFFCLRSANTGGSCTLGVGFGGPGDIPATGDNTDILNESTNANIKYDTIGVWISSNGFFCLRDSNVTGPCDVATQFGSAGDTPLMGHWFNEGAGFEVE